jgi:hypothetical protein
VSGGSGWKQFRQRERPELDQLWSGARGGGGEATGPRNLDGVARLGGIPAGSGGGGSVSRGGRRSNAVGRRGKCGQVCSGTGSQKKGRRERKGGPWLSSGLRR